MFSQQRLITAIDAELNDIHKIADLYEQYCRNLRLEDIFSTDTVYFSAKRAASGFGHKKDTFAFMEAAWRNAKTLCDKVLEGKYKPRYYREQTINERGKFRVIRPPAFECKVVQKVLCDYLVRPLLEPLMIQTSYASIKGRGTALMYQNILHALNLRLEKYGEKSFDYAIVTADFSGYFASIPMEVLFDEFFARQIKDERITKLMRMFSPEEFGLSLGNELSQVPASFYPSPLDHWADSRSKDAYYRFMDDTLMILKQEDVERYIESYKKITEEKLKLQIKDKKIHVYQFGEDFVFCKERFLWDRNKKLYYRVINPQAIANETRKLKTFREKYREGDMSEEEINTQFNGVIGMIKSHPNTYKQQEKLQELYQQIFTEERSGGKR